MQITQITVRRSVKVKLGNFEDTNFDVSTTIAFAPGEQFTRDDLWGYVNHMLREELEHQGIQPDHYKLG